MYSDGMQKSLCGKKILFFAPPFFGYENAIRNKMEEMGAAVVAYNVRSVTGPLAKAFLKITPNFFKQKTAHYYDDIMRKHHAETFDYVLIIKCDMPNGKILNKLRNSFPKAIFCLHLWDSLKNIPGTKNKIPYFDVTTSFDKNDCNNVDGLTFRPLFFADEFCSDLTGKAKYDYDLSFCGTVHSDRYRILKQIEEQCRKSEMDYYGFYYLQSKFIYHFYKIFKPEFKYTKLSDFSLKSKSRKEIADIVERSKAIIDIQHPRQTGLTMRTIEMLGMHKKLITTNYSIMDYDFYNPKNIYIIDRKHPHLEPEFLQSPYEESDLKIYDNYKLENWILDVLGIRSVSQ